MKIQVLIMWWADEGGGIVGSVTISKPTPVKVYNPFKHIEVDGVHLDTLHKEEKKYTSQLAFFLHIVKEYYTNRRYKWERVKDDPECCIIFIEGIDTQSAAV
ncbi:MAG: hypothetical protein IKN39_02095 [Clostridia bacterium]|nr:hypothetical protein [Clostridia bacterium]